MTESEILDCPHGARCGGCAFLGVPYAEELNQKHAFVQRGIARYPQLAKLKLAPVAGASPTQAYRARAKLVFGTDGALGLYERDSHSVVDIPECRVLSPVVARVVAAARRVLSRATPAARRPGRAAGGRRRARDADRRAGHTDRGAAAPGTRAARRSERGALGRGQLP